MKLRDHGESAVSYPFPVRTNNVPKVRFSVTLGEDPEIELVLL